MQLAIGEKVWGTPRPDQDCYRFDWVTSVEVIQRPGFLLNYLDYYKYPEMRLIREDMVKLMADVNIQRFWLEAVDAHIGSNHGRLFTAIELNDVFSRAAKLELHFNHWMRWSKIHLVPA